MTVWSLEYNEFDPAQEKLREALCTLGNGYFATRGAASESQADSTHYPGTYLAGGYNRLETAISGKVAETRARELCKKLSLAEEEQQRWRDISRKMRVVFHDDGIISQFEGYDELREFDWEGYRNKYGDIQRLDRILKSEGDTPNRYKASKKADVFMLFYLFSAVELQELFHRSGYPFEYETIPKNIAYYIQRTSHGSTLSRVVHSWVLARKDRDHSWKFFTEALESDISDLQGGTTPEGIHLGAMAGTMNMIQVGYTGLETRGNVLWFNPCLPKELARLHMHIHYRGHNLSIEIFPGYMKITACRARKNIIQIGYKDKIHELDEGKTLEITFK